MCVCVRMIQVMYREGLAHRFYMFPIEVFLLKFADVFGRDVQDRGLQAHREDYRRGLVTFLT